MTYAIIAAIIAVALWRLSHNLKVITKGNWRERWRKWREKEGEGD